MFDTKPYRSYAARFPHSDGVTKFIELCDEIDRLQTASAEAPPEEWNQKFKGFAKVDDITNGAAFVRAQALADAKARDAEAEPATVDRGDGVKIHRPRTDSAIKALQATKDIESAHGDGCPIDPEWQGGIGEAHMREAFDGPGADDGGAH